MGFFVCFCLFVVVVVCFVCASQILVLGVLLPVQINCALSPVFCFYDQC